MGTGSSRIEASPAAAAAPRRLGSRRKRLLASLLCGGGAAGADGRDGVVPSSSSSSNSAQVESQLLERTMMPENFRASGAAKDLQISSERHLKVSSGHPSSSTINDHLRYSHLGYHENKENSMGTENAETSGLDRSSRKEVGPSGSFNIEIAHSGRTSHDRSSSIEPDLVEPLLENVDTSVVRSTEAGDSITESGLHASLIMPEGSMPHLEARALAPDGTSFTSILSSERSDISHSTRSSLRGESDAISFGAEVFTLRGSQEDSGIILNDDMVSISSNDAPGHSRESHSSGTRRNNRRVLWDAFSRRSSRRYLDSDPDELGFYSRWLDLGDDLFDDELEESRYFRRRRLGSSRLSHHPRFQIGARRRAIFDGSNEQATTCPLGIHTLGRCTCDAFLVAEESSARASISRIVMLTEALFEVLDEIHRQPTSLSLSMVSVQASEAVVNSLPSKSYRKLDTTQGADEMEQCHICLTEYEEGDQIRVLPCNHEFHMHCVDKWLKEVHRVCPLCRGDVCEGVS